MLIDAYIGRFFTKFELSRFDPFWPLQVLTEIGYLYSLAGVTLRNILQSLNFRSASGSAHNRWLFIQMRSFIDYAQMPTVYAAKR